MVVIATLEHSEIDKGTVAGFEDSVVVVVTCGVVCVGLARSVGFLFGEVYVFCQFLLDF